MNPDILQNDQALDFLEELENTTRRWPLVTKALQTALSETDLETDEAGHAVAAAEIVAAARGHARSELRDDLIFWAQRRAAKNLEELSDLAIKSLARIGKDSEVADLWGEAGLDGELQRQIADLVERLRKPIAPASSVAKIRKIRAKPGDVFQVSLPDGRYAYGRLARGKKLLDFQIYSVVSNEPGSPPIGCREYLFAAGGMSYEIERGICPIVGRDPWGDDEEDPQFLVCGTYPVFHMQGRREASASECYGAIRFIVHSLPGLTRRIVQKLKGDAISDEWLVLPDREGNLRRMPWSDWDPEWGKKWEEKRQQRKAATEPHWPVHDASNEK